MDVNDNAGCLNERVAPTLFAGKPAPTRDWVHTIQIVGAGLPAMEVNDDAGCLNERSVWALFAGKPAPTGIGVRF
ncbi:hypothetical protein J2Y74_004265 [Pseudomonas migulae]|uniref:hypothetical protein n=1 Tax=Pseudomonas migulae TaxID=78543 RepID=UPI00209DF312|nr:hypothetical protein [Pseudomonas migulae]MCP1519955.1 hypothetical protein [Pseudomonas migulae]